jgi:hypothetical protein
MRTCNVVPLLWRGTALFFCGDHFKTALVSSFYASRHLLPTLEETASKHVSKVLTWAGPEK